MNGFVWVNGAPTEILAYYLGVSPGWIETMGIPLVSGRDIREGEAFPDVALVNEAFVRQCFGGENPTGRWFEKETGDGVTRHRIEVIGVVRDARYRNMREPITPTAYVPFHARDRNGAVVPRDWGTFVVRTASQNPLALASVLRREVARARPEFRVSNIRTQKQLVDRHTVRERLLATLALFFALVALLLAGVGLYGVLDYSVLQRQREIGIRMAIGATSRDIAGRLTGEALMMVLVGAFIGLGAGVASARYIKTLLYSVTATDPAMLLLPSVVILAATLLAAFPAVLRAVRTDPVAKLRAE